MPERVPSPALLVRFAGELRTAGLAVGTGDILAYCSALSTLDPADLVDLYWAGRATLVSRRRRHPRYDEVFRRYFLGAERSGPRHLDAACCAQRRGGGRAGHARAPSRARTRRRNEAVLGWMASDVDALKHHSFAACTPGGARRAAPDHGQDPADPAAPPDPADAPPARSGTVPTCAGPSGNRCGCTASPRSCTGGGARCGCGR